ncbi:MAG: O-antigen ligase family protein [Actinomycetota bacterium]
MARDASPDRWSTIAGWCAAGIVTAVPLLVLPPAFAPFRVAKLLGVAVLVAVGLTACAAAGRLIWPRWRWFLPWLAAIGVSTLVGVAPWMSVFGAPNRGAGLIAASVGVAAFALGASVGDRGDIVRLAVRGLVIAGAIVGLLAVAERFGLEIVDVGEPTGVERARSTWGSATFAGTHLAMVAPIAVVQLRSADPRWRRFALVALVMIGAGLVATGTRGAWLATVVALALIVPVLRRTRSSGSADRRPSTVPATARWVLGGLAAVLVLLLVVPQLTRSTALGRIDLWATTTSALSDAPLLGSGLDSQRIVLPQGIDAAFEREHGSDALHDRAHSLPLDLLVTTGIVGTAAFAALVGRLALDFRRRRGTELMPLAMGASLVAYLVALLFAFADPVIDPLAWLIAGLLWGALAGDDRSGRSISTTQTVALTSAIAIAGFAVIAVSLTETVADIRTRQALDAADDGDLARALDQLESAASLAPARFDIRQASVRLTTRAVQSGEEVATAPTSGLIDQALEQLEAAEQIAGTRDPDLAMDRAELLTAAGRATDALAVYDLVLTAYPSSSRAHLGLGLAAAQLGNLEGAERAWRTAADLAPNDPRALINLAALAEDRDNIEQAIELLDDALQIDPSNATARRALEQLAADAS